MNRLLRQCIHKNEARRFRVLPLYTLEMGREGVLLYIISALIVICHCDRLSTGSHQGESLSLGASLVGNQTITSKNGTFELGFFSPNGSNNWYIGIWYANIPEKMVVWVGNRDSPAKNKPGILKLSRQGNLGLFDADGTSLWSVTISNNSSRAVLLDSGNFVILSDDNKSETLWQSFDHPVDTWLPGMRFGGQQKLICWKSSIDPAPGLISFQVDPAGAPQFVLIWNNSVQFWESGNWDNKSYSEVPEATLSYPYNISVERTNSGLYFSYELATRIKNFLKVTSGGVQTYVLFDDSKWTMVLCRPRDQCAAYGFCGPYGRCNSNNLDFCSCVEGFTPKDKHAKNSQDWQSAGCVRERPLNCDSKKGMSTDEFKESDVILPDASASSYSAPTKTACQKACLHNCSCTAFSFDFSSRTCKIWSGDLLNMNSSPSSRSGNVSIRIAASALPNHKKLSSSKLKIIIIVSALALIVLSIFSFFIWKKHRPQPVKETSEDSSDSFLRMYSYMELKIATRNFRSKLGSGGFGSVFKGSLIDGTLVAVKRLKCSSRHDEKQFRAEINSLGSIQHANLIRLRGFCAQGSRRLLVYDYMPNGSLNSVLFTRDSKCKGKVLDWKARYQIALGTARGLLYLHDKCRDRIIHGDIKPENILLDANFSPKIADFGLAKVVGRDFSRVLTTTRGTRGYLAPEWISGLPITSKVDVYSFGITLLEIISGRRSLDFKVRDSSQYYFPAWAATQIYQGKIMNIVDTSVAMEGDIEELRRAGIVGLLCIEREEEMRPSIEQVVRMLEGKMELQTPQMLISAVKEREADQSHSDSDIEY